MSAKNRIKVQAQAPAPAVKPTFKGGSVVSLSLDNYSTPVLEVRDRKSGIAQFGIDNLYPQHTIRQYESSPTHQAIIRSKAAYVAGDGFEFGGATEEYVKVLGHGKSINRIGKALALDLALHNGYAFQVTWGIDGKTIARISYVDFSHVRELYDNDGNIETYLLSKDWDKNPSKTEKRVVQIPPFNPEKVGLQVTNDEAGNPLSYSLAQPNQLYYYKGLTPGMRYYPKPTHIACDMYVKIDGLFGDFHSNNLLNGLLPSFMLEIFGPEPEEGEKSTQSDKIVKGFKGTKGKKGLVVWNPNGSEQAMKVHVLDVKNNESRYLEIAKFAIQQIITGHMLTSPTLAGLAGAGGLGGNASEIESAFKLYFATVISDMQDQIIEGIQHIFDAAGMPITVKIVSRLPFAQETTVTKTEAAPAASTSNTPT